MRISVLLLMAAVLAVVSCSRVRIVSLINNTGGRIEILHASWQGDRTETLNGSPWYVPFRANPTLAQGYQLELGADYTDWIMEIGLRGGCRAWFTISASRDMTSDDPAWLAMGYGDGLLQLNEDLQLYRIPANSTAPVDVSAIRQPRGYPIAPTEQTGCAATKQS